MQLELSPEQTMLVETVERFTAAQVRPRAGAWERAAALPEGVLGELAGMGLLGVLVPADEGGSELGVADLALALAALAAGSPSLALVVLAHNLVGAALVAATESRHRSALPRIAAGELLCTTSLPLAGLDELAAGRGDTLAGVSAPMPALEGAGLAVVTVRDGDARRLVVVEPPAAAGREATPTLGLAAAGLARLRLEGAAASDLAASAGEIAAIGRLGVAAIAVGLGEAALAEARAYALERRQFGQPLAEFQATQWKLVNAATELAAARALTIEAAGRPPSERGAASLEAFLLATDAAQRAADDAVQIHGGYGYTREFAVERLYRDAKACTVLFAGRDEQRVALARHLLASA